MPIVIRELFPSDPLSEALEKINFNFDQIVLAGGGPPGPQGLQGVPGIPGPQGERGDHWQVGASAPTADHGPNFGSLKDYDYWIDPNGIVRYWDSIGATWNASGVSLKGATGAAGPVGGSNEFSYYQGKTGNNNTPTNSVSGNYIPDVITGATTVPSGRVDFITINNAEKAGLFIGDPNWAYNNLNNFNVYDLAYPSGTSPSQRMNPKTTIIQNNIDYTGFGGLMIGAYGVTGATGPLVNQVDFIGSTAAITDAFSFFNAGFGIKNTGGILSHVFKAGTRRTDFELFAGDEFNAVTALNIPNTPNLILKTTVGGKTKISDTSGDRAIIGSTASIFTGAVSTGHPTMPSFESGSTFDTSGLARVRGALRVGNFLSTISRVDIGHGRTSNGQSYLGFYTDGSTPTTANFAISKNGGSLGNATIANSGLLSIDSTTMGISADDISGFIKFSTTSGIEIARINTVSQRVGIGISTPNEKLEVNGNIHVSGGDRTIFNRSNNYLAFGTNNTERARITSTGNIGIGITSPTAKLHVYGQTLGYQIKAEGATSSFIQIKGGGGQCDIGFEDGDNSFLVQSGSSPQIYQTTRTNLVLRSNGYSSFGNEFNLDSRVEIDGANAAGTSSHNWPLSIYTANTGSQFSTNGISLLKKYQGSAITSGTILGSVGYGGWNGTQLINGSSLIQSSAEGTWSTTGSPSRLTFFTSPNSSFIPQERMRIDKDGKIFINHSNTLNVDASIINWSNGDMIFGTNNTERMRIDANGGVMITGGVSTTTSNRLVVTGGSFTYGTNTTLSGSRVHLLCQPLNGSGAVNTSNFAISVNDIGSTWHNFEFFGFTNGSSFNIGAPSSKKISFFNFNTYGVMDFGFDGFYMNQPTGNGAIEIGRAGSNGNLIFYQDLSTNLLGGPGLWLRNNGALLNLSVSNDASHTANGKLQVRCDSTGKSVDGAAFYASGDANNIINFVNSTNATRGFIKGVNASSVSYNTTSDKRLKTDVKRLNSGLDIIMKLRPVSFTWTRDSDKDEGFIAQEVYSIIPKMRPDISSYCDVDSANFDIDNPVDKDGKEYLYSLDYGKFTPYLTAAIQEQQSIIVSQEEKIKSLEGKISAIEKMLNI
jgi:hypothetical protein